MSSSGIGIAGANRRNGDTGTLEAECIIDGEHLERITLGDGGLEREVLQIFVRQAAIMIGRIAGSDRKSVVAVAHTLTGSARGIGAWRVARAAERVEYASEEGGETLNAAITDLKAASLEASAAIGTRLARKAR